jgi:hypothetical protein
MIFLENDDQVIEFIYNLVKNNLYYCKKKLYLKKGIIWIDNKEEISAYLLVFISELPIYKKVGVVQISYTKYYNKTEYYIKKIIKKIKINNIKDDLLDLFIISTKNKLVFNNGYLDFSSKKFYEHDDSIYTMIKIDRDFNTRINYEYVKHVKKILTDIFGGSNIDRVLTYFARVISNCHDDNLDQDFYFRACTLGGKSTLFELFYNSLTDYVGSSMIQDKYKRLIFIYNYDYKFTRIRHNNSYRIFYISTYKLQKHNDINYIESNIMFLSDDNQDINITDEIIIKQNPDILDKLVFTKEYNDALIHLLLEYT